MMDAATTTCDEFAGSCCGGGDPVVTNGFGIAPLTYLQQALHHITGKENNTHYYYNNKKLQKKQKKQTLHSTSRRSQLSILPAYSSPVVPAYAARSAATHTCRLHNNLNSHTPALHYATLPPASPISKYPSLSRLATTTMHSTSLFPASQP